MLRARVEYAIYLLYSIASRAQISALATAAVSVPRARASAKSLLRLIVFEKRLCHLTDAKLLECLLPIVEVVLKLYSYLDIVSVAL